MRHYTTLLHIIQPNNQDLQKVLHEFKICEEKQVQFSKEFFEHNPLYQLEKNSKKANTLLFCEYIKNECIKQGIDPIS